MSLFIIASNTFRELLRNKILSLIAFFWGVLIVFSLILANLSLWQNERIITDFWLFMIELSGLVSVVFIGWQMLYREFEGRTIYLILSKPLSRSDFILGKFFGFSLVLFIITGLEGVVLLSIVMLTQKFPGILFFMALVSILLKLFIILASILFFSTFLRPLISIFMTLALTIISHGVSGILDMGEKLHNTTLIVLAKILMTIFPNFEALNFAKNSLHTPIILENTVYTGVYLGSMGYLLLLLLFTAFIFERKRFEHV